MIKQLQKRFWIFYSAEYEPCLGLGDFESSYDTKAAAMKCLERAPEWGAMFDSHTGKQVEIYHGKLSESSKVIA